MLHSGFQLQVAVGEANPRLRDSDGTYGYRRLDAQLGRWGVRCSTELVRTLARRLGLMAYRLRLWRHGLTELGLSGSVPDLLRRDFTAEAPGTTMVGDITYISTWEGWVFLGTRAPLPHHGGGGLGDG